MYREVSGHYPHLEKLEHSWFRNQHKVGFSVSTLDVITKALHIEPNFDHGCYKRQRWLAYKFIAQNSLVFSSQIVKSSFRKCGFFNDVDIDIYVALEYI